MQRSPSLGGTLSDIPKNGCEGDYVRPHSKHLDIRQKYSAARQIFDSILGVLKVGHTRSFALDIKQKNILDNFKCQFTVAFLIAVSMSLVARPSIASIISSVLPKISWKM